VLFEIRASLYWVLFHLLSLLPHRAAFRAARWLGYRRFRRNRNRLTVREGLIARGREENAALLQRAFESFAAADLELCLFGRLARPNIDGFIRMEGLENLQRCLSEGRGAILYSAHVHNMFLFASALGIAGYKPNVVGNPDGGQSSRAERWFRYERTFAIMQERLGCTFSFMGASQASAAVGAAKALKRNEVVLMFIDKPTITSTVEVDFLGSRTDFPLGPVALAQATGAPLLDFYVHRPAADGPALARIGEPFGVTSDATASTQECARRLEQRVLEHPFVWTQACLFDSKHDGTARESGAEEYTETTASRH
jgi:KDO2-lipid IV(A) lauroyltransferase